MLRFSPTVLKEGRTCIASKKQFNGTWLCSALAFSLFLHPKCPCADILSPLPGAGSPAGLALQLGELPSPLFLDVPDEGFPVSLIGLIPSSNPFGGTRRVELPPAPRITPRYTFVCWAGTVGIASHEADKLEIPDQAKLLWAQRIFFTIIPPPPKHLNS